MSMTSLRALLLTAWVAIALGASPRVAADNELTVSSRTFPLTTAIADGEPREVAVLMDESHLKLATVTLRDGTDLPAHTTAVPATVQVLIGRGIIQVGDESIPVATGSIVWLAAGAEHSVIPATGSDMLLLVHYLRDAGAKAPSTEHQH